MAEKSSGTRYFQYLTSEKRGKIVELLDTEIEDNSVYLKFSDGSRCNEDLILPLNDKNIHGDIVMAEVEDANNIWKFEERWVGRQEERWEENADGQKVCVQPFVKGKKKLKIIPPHKTPPHKIKSKFTGVEAKSQEVQQMNQSSQQTQPQNISNQNIDTTDPVYIMMTKAKKFDTEVPVNITISLPTKSLYNVAKESFDNGSKKVIEYIISNMDDKKLKDALKQALYESYEDNKEDLKQILYDSYKNNNESDSSMNIDDVSGQDLYEPEALEPAVQSEPRQASKEEIEKYKNKF